MKTSIGNIAGILLIALYSGFSPLLIALFLVIPVYRCKSTQTKGTSCGRSPTLKESDIERNIMLAINDVKQVNCFIQWFLPFVNRSFFG